MIILRGVAIVLTAIFTFVLARLTQVGWLYLLDAVLWGVLMLSFVLPWLSVMSLRAQRRLVRPNGRQGCPSPTEGEKVMVDLQLENPRFWPRYMVSASYSCPLSDTAEPWTRFYVPRLNGSDTTTLSNSVECYRRGSYSFMPVLVESKVPFGLFRRRRRLEAPLSVLVYPQVNQLQKLPLLEGVRGTSVRPRRTREGQDISSSRRYFPGDPLRHIHWRNTARTGQPMVKEFEDSQENTLVIAFDAFQDIGEGRESTLEYSIKIAASVAEYAKGKGSTVRVLAGTLPGHETPWNQLLKDLALMEAGQGVGIPTLVDSIPAGMRTLVIVSETDQDGIDAISHRISGMNEVTIVVLEGFGERPDADLETPPRIPLGTGISLVRCRQGDLGGALRSLEQLNGSPIPTPGNVRKLDLENQVSNLV